MSHHGSPAAAAVVAVLIRKEWLETGTDVLAGSASLRRQFKKRRVRNVLLVKVKGGPCRSDDMCPQVLQAWPFKVRDRAPVPPHAPKRY